MAPRIQDKDNQEIQELYEIYKDELTNENNNINQRVIWNIFAQAGLMGAYAGALGAPKEGKSPPFTMQLDFVVWIIPVVSLLLALLTLPVVYASLQYMKNVKQDYRNRAGSSPSGRPPLEGRPDSHWLTLAAEYAPAVIPTVIAAAWLVALICQSYSWLAAPPA